MLLAAARACIVVLEHATRAVLTHVEERASAADAEKSDSLARPRQPCELVRHCAQRYHGGLTPARARDRAAPAHRRLTKRVEIPRNLRKSGGAIERHRRMVVGIDAEVYGAGALRFRHPQHLVEEAPSPTGAPAFGDDVELCEEGVAAAELQVEAPRQNGVARSSRRRR